MKINDFTFEEKQRALDEAFVIMNADKANAKRLKAINLRISLLLGSADEKGNGEVNVQSIYNDMTWLYEQAERAQELESIWETTARNYFGENVNLKAENKRFREALTRYADRSNYVQSFDDMETGYPPEIVNDAGYAARKALEIEEYE